MSLRDPEPKRVVKIGYDAEDIKSALRARHPAKKEGSFVGRWVTLEEWCGIDLLALDAWQSANVVGYEVKVSRGDMRTELLNPWKRMEAVSRCTEFYFAVPAGMLTKEELVFDQPDWDLKDFERERCKGTPEVKLEGHGYRRFGGQCSNPRRDYRGRSSRFISIDYPKGYRVRLPIPAVINTEHEQVTHWPHCLDDLIWDQGFELVLCPMCNGKGYVTKSRVELEAPTLWVPRDVGLIEISRSGCHVVKSAPRNKTPKPIIGEVSDHGDAEVQNRRHRQSIADIVRWASNRPDPRHR